MMDPMSIHEVVKRLPHRYPFLLVDRVIEWQSGESLTAIKNVTINEPFFQGHFPVRPVMPGVLILEALAQATGLLAFGSEPHDPADETLYLFVAIDKARFRRQVEPGDQLYLNVRLLRVMRGMWRFAAEASVDGEQVATAELMCTQRSANA